MTTCSTLFFKVDDPARSSIVISGTEGGGHHITVCDQTCRLCVAECPVKALSVNAQGVVMLDRKLCIGCLACVAVCPIGAMRYLPGSPSPFKCVACGSCAKRCPEEAIRIKVEEA